MALPPQNFSINELQTGELWKTNDDILDDGRNRLSSGKKQLAHRRAQTKKEKHVLWS